MSGELKYGKDWSASSDRLSQALIGFNRKIHYKKMKEIVEKILTDSDVRESNAFKEATLARSALNPWDDIA